MKYAIGMWIAGTVTAILCVGNEGDLNGLEMIMITLFVSFLWALIIVEAVLLVGE